jgi:teichuronic acid biosynthesis glycosyltransferase TuaC
VPDAPATPSIAIISHMYPQAPRPHYGVFVSEQTRALVGIGVTVADVVVPVPSAPWPLPLLSPRWRQYADAERRRTDFGTVPVDLPRYAAFPRRLLPGVSAASLCRAILRDVPLAERIRSADMIVAHTALLDGEAARRLSLALGLPYVVFVHGADLRENLRADAPAAVRATVTAVLREASAVVGVSEAVVRGLRTRVPGLEDVEALHNGVDTEMFRPRSDACAETDGAARALRTLSAGRLVETKANDDVLRSVAILTAEGVSIEHTIAGDGPERPRLAALATELGIADRVRFIGAYAHEDLPGLLHACDLFVLPSRHEAFGVVYLEAMACGVPVVAASDAGAPEIVDDRVDGFLVPPRDINAVVDAIRAFAAAPGDARARTRAAARAKAESFTWTANARGLLAIVREALA